VLLEELQHALARDGVGEPLAMKRTIQGSHIDGLPSRQ
jgi:hypothetical protein